MNRNKNDVGKVTLKFVEEAFELMNPDQLDLCFCLFPDSLQPFQNT